MTACPHCGCKIDGKTKPRSAPQLRRFFAMLRAMYQHWPEDTQFQPESEEHLRKFILIRAGYRETTDIPVTFAEDQPGLTKLTALSIEAALKAAGAYAFIRPHPRAHSPCSAAAFPRRSAGLSMTCAGSISGGLVPA